MPHLLLRLMGATCGACLPCCGLLSPWLSLRGRHLPRRLPTARCLRHRRCKTGMTAWIAARSLAPPSARPSALPALCRNRALQQSSNHPRDKTLRGRRTRSCPLTGLVPTHLREPPPAEAVARRAMRWRVHAHGQFPTARVQRAFQRACPGNQPGSSRRCWIDGEDI